MENEEKENPLKLPKQIIGKRKLWEINESGGVKINTADPKTPSLKIKHQSDPGSLPEQEKPKDLGKN
jgi:hypothetical protein